MSKLLPAVLFAGLAWAQVQMPSSTIQGQPRTAPAKAWPKKAAPNGKATASAQGATAQQDKQIEATIRAKLAKSKIGKDGFTVRVQGGVAYWDGATTVVQHKGSATRMAKSAGAAPRATAAVRTASARATGRRG